MSEFEDLMKKLLESVSGLTRSDVEKRIKEKQDKIGAGYLTKQGALFIIASEFGVKLSSDRKNISKTYAFDELQIDTISKDDLDTKFKTIRSAKNTRTILSSLMSLSMMGGLLAAIFVTTTFSRMEEVFWGSAIFLIFAISYLTYFFIKKPLPKINKQEKYFSEFYDVLKTLKKYQYRPHAPKIGKYTTKLDDLADYIEEWTRYAPSEFTSIPKTLSYNLRSKIIPIFKDNLEKDILSFINDFEKIVFFCYSKEPTMELFQKLNEKLNDIIPPSTKKPVKQKTFDGKTLAGYSVIAPAGGVVVGLIMHLIDPSRLYDSFGFGILAAIMLIGVIFTVYFIKKKS